MTTKASFLKAAKARHMIITALSSASRAMSVPELRQQNSDLQKIHPNLERTRQLIERMVKNELVTKTGHGLYTVPKPNGSATAPARSARPLTVDRLSRIEHKLDLLLKALDVREH
jgi:hypothetical protein